MISCALAALGSFAICYPIFYLISEWILVRIDEPRKAKTVSRRGAYPRIDRYCPNCNTLLYGKEKKCHSCGQLIRYKGEKE